MLPRQVDWLIRPDTQLYERFDLLCFSGNMYVNRLSEEEACSYCVRSQRHAGDGFDNEADQDGHVMEVCVCIDHVLSSRTERKQLIEQECYRRGSMREKE